MTTTHPRAAGGLDRGWPAYAGHTAGEFLVVVAMIAVGALIVFGLVAKAVTPDNAATFAASFGAVGLLSILVFWTGLPAVLASGAVACAVVDGRKGALSTAAKVGIGLAAVTLALAVFTMIYG